MNDNYSHDDHNLIYIIENIPGPTDESSEYENLISNFNSQITNHCVCNETCKRQTCPCLLKSADMDTGCNEQHLDVTYQPIECNDLCTCSEKCENRLVQRGPADCLYVSKCSDVGKGLGLFTKQHIPRGLFICEYAGEIITKSQALLRHNINSLNEKMNYIFCLREYSSGNVVETFVDPSNFGNIGRYINHSCDANCKILPVRVNTLIPKLAIFSCRDIMPNSEITFNYGSHSNTDLNYYKEVKRKKCLCGNSNCKKWLPFDMY